ncbi:hypothetical protein [Rathayibacter sp. AY1A5]|uniref:hypothetical protein n=1 Tax=Rathayibacter sp. AY1A5 TaxID=2080523 RepID=UPI0011B0B7B0|nr:hypothetical protein [Rathayibacter sp. AY1A5]
MSDDTDDKKPLDPLSDFSIPGDTDLHTTGDASGADGDEVAEPERTRTEPPALRGRPSAPRSRRPA